MPKYYSDTDGRVYSEARGTSMTETTPPKDYRWHHYSITHGQGNDSAVSPLAQQTRANYKEMRLAWLDQFDLEIAEEGAFRYWRWYTEEPGGRTCVWWERRPLGSPLPKVSGLWPNDG